MNCNTSTGFIGSGIRRVTYLLGIRFGLQRLHPGFSTKARKAIRDHNPWCPAVEVDVKLRGTIDRTLDVRKRDIDLIRVLLGFTEQRTST